MAVPELIVLGSETFHEVKALQPRNIEEASVIELGSEPLGVVNEAKEEQP